MTLIFVPKILAIFVAMLIALPFMADALQGHMARSPPASWAGNGRAPKRMSIDVSFLPAFAAAFMLIFARIGTMVMLLPGLGELTRVAARAADGRAACSPP